MPLQRIVTGLAALALLAGACSDDDTDDAGGLTEIVAVDDAAPEDAADTVEPVEPEPDAADDDVEPPPADRPVETAAVQVDGAELPLLTGADDAAIGQVAPALSGTAVDGTPMTIEPGEGPMIIGFFAHWCPHCQAEVPVVVDWLADGGLPDDVQLVAVSTAVSEMRDNHPPSRWFVAEEWRVPTMADDTSGSAHFAYGAGGFPYWVVLAADGTVVSRSAGELGREGLDDLVALARG